MYIFGPSCLASQQNVSKVTACIGTSLYGPKYKCTQLSYVMDIGIVFE